MAEKTSVLIRTLPLALALLVLLPKAAAADTSTRIIVQREPGLSAAERADIRADADVRFVETLPLPRVEVVAAVLGDVSDALRDLERDPDVVYAELDRPITAAAPDPDFDLLWGLHNEGSFTFGTIENVPDADIDAPEAWEMSTGQGKTIAVIDTGADASHPDLAASMAPGWDFVGNDPYPTDVAGHGTHVAGTVAAVRDNGTGGVGAAPDARIMPLKVLGDNGVGIVSDAIEAYHYAGEKGVAVVNASLGGTTYSPTEYAAIADNPDTLFVVAAGNGGADGVGDNIDTSSTKNYPCAYDLENILCVGASRHDDQRARFSNRGNVSVDVFAPGYQIFSTAPGAQYDTMDGTSMATPHVAGIAAMLLSRNPDLTPSAIREGVITFADDKPDMENRAVSDGRANAEAVLLGVDSDNDGTPEGTDNCPTIANPGQQPEDCPTPADPDGDAITGQSDVCPREAASYAANGCPGNDPGADGDYWPGSLDNCPTVFNPGQQNGDGRADGGDACDNDFDNDGRANGADSCPTVYALTADGCPLPPNGDGDAFADAADACPTEGAQTRNGCPLPALTALSRKVTKRRSVIVRASTTRAAVVRILVQRKRGSRWVKVKKRTLATSANRVKLTVSRLRRGRHRIKVAVYSNAGSGTSATRYFRVR